MKGNQHSTYGLSGSQLARNLRFSARRDLRNRVRSILEDRKWIDSWLEQYKLPIFVNARAGTWYFPEGSPCYFKSTDGHVGTWTFSTTRLNLNVAISAGSSELAIVDVTKYGKRYPDSLSRTIPIWMRVINEIMGFEDIPKFSECMPTFIPASESSHLEQKISSILLEIPSEMKTMIRLSLENKLRKPLFPYYHHQEYIHDIIDDNEVNHLPLGAIRESDKYSIIHLLSASRFVPPEGDTISSIAGWYYIPGAGDDAETWTDFVSLHMGAIQASVEGGETAVEVPVRGVRAVITPSLLWEHRDAIIACSSDEAAEQLLVQELLTKEREAANSKVPFSSSESVPVDMDEAGWPLISQSPPTSLTSFLDLYSRQSTVASHSLAQSCSDGKETYECAKIHIVVCCKSRSEDSVEIMSIRPSNGDLALHVMPFIPAPVRPYPVPQPIPFSPPSIVPICNNSNRSDCENGRFIEIYPPVNKFSHSKNPSRQTLELFPLLDDHISSIIEELRVRGPDLDPACSTTPLACNIFICYSDDIEGAAVAATVFAAFVSLLILKKCDPAVQLSKAAVRAEIARMQVCTNAGIIPSILINDISAYFLGSVIRSDKRASAKSSFLVM